jgi:glycerol uptake facilitator-like aquaporin
LNPAIGIAIELVQAAYNSEPILVLYSLTMVIGPLLGAIIAAWFFDRFYRVVYVNWK